MTVRILHFADLHLDRSFATLRMASSEAVKRREELRTTLRRIVDLAIERDIAGHPGHDRTGQRRTIVVVQREPKCLRRRSMAHALAC
jgi:hypothetical protein